MRHFQKKKVKKGLAANSFRRYNDMENNAGLKNVTRRAVR
jgi:hypothetical protein